MLDSESIWAAFLLEFTQRTIQAGPRVRVKFLDPSSDLLGALCFWLHLGWVVE